MELATNRNLQITGRDARFLTGIYSDLSSCLKNLEQQLDEMHATCNQLLGIFPKLTDLTDQEVTLAGQVSLQMGMESSSVTTLDQRWSNSRMNPSEDPVETHVYNLWKRSTPVK